MLLRLLRSNGSNEDVIAGGKLEDLLRLLRIMSG